MRSSTRSKRLDQSQRFLAGRGIPRAYGVGEIGPDPRRTLFLIFCGVLAVAFFSFVIYSVIVFPGVLLIWAVYVAVERSTCVVVTDEGVAILARSEFNGRPRKFVALLPPHILSDPTIERSGRYVHVAAYRLWLRKKEFDALMSRRPAPGSGPVPTVPMQPAGVMNPTFGDSSQQRTGFQPLFTERIQWPPPTTEPAQESQGANSYWARQTGGSRYTPGSGDDAS